MSGHSKFANIKHKKEKNDAAKGKIFTIIVSFGILFAFAFAITSRSLLLFAGSGPPSFTATAISRPSGTAIIVDALTDNKNRTAANVRNAFTKGKGNVGTPGCVSYMFDKKGQIIIDKENCDMDADDLMMAALDAGAEDFSEEEDSFEIITDPDSFSEVRQALEDAGIEMASAEVTMIPQTYVELTDEQDLYCINKILDLLDADDDVQQVYHNWDE